MNNFCFSCGESNKSARVEMVYPISTSSRVESRIGDLLDFLESSKFKAPRSEIAQIDNLSEEFEEENPDLRRIERDLLYIARKYPPEETNPYFTPLLLKLVEGEGFLGYAHDWDKIVPKLRSHANSLLFNLEYAGSMDPFDDLRDIVLDIQKKHSSELTSQQDSILDGIIEDMGEDNLTDLLLEMSQDPDSALYEPATKDTEKDYYDDEDNEDFDDGVRKWW